MTVRQQRMICNGQQRVRSLLMGLRREEFDNHVMIDSRFQFSLRIKIFLYWGQEVSGTIYLQMILEKANQRTTYLIFLSFLPV